MRCRAADTHPEAVVVEESVEILVIFWFEFVSYPGDVEAPEYGYLLQNVVYQNLYGIDGPLVAIGGQVHHQIAMRQRLHSQQFDDFILDTISLCYVTNSGKVAQ